MRGPALLHTELGEERRSLGPSQYARCAQAGCSNEVRFAFTRYCMKHHIQHPEESELMEKKFSDEQIRKAFSAHPGNLKAAALSISMSDAGFGYRVRKLGLVEAGKPRTQKRRSGKRGGLGPAAAELRTPEAKVADTQPPPVRPTTPSRSTSAALAPVPACAPMGSDSVLDQVEGVISAAQQIVAALRPLGDAARHQVLMLVGGAGVGLPARGEG